MTVISVTFPSISCVIYMGKNYFRQSARQTCLPLLEMLSNEIKRLKMKKKNKFENLEKKNPEIRHLPTNHPTSDWCIIPASSEFTICHVVRHGNMNSIQNPSTMTNPTIYITKIMESVCVCVYMYVCPAMRFAML